MDPQKLSQLDPKLREAYQRVMGTPIPTPQTAPQAAPVQTQTPPPPIEPTIPTPAIPDPIPAPTTIPTPEPTQVPPPAIEVPQAIPTPEPSIPEPQPTMPNNFVQMNSEVAAAPVSPNFSTPAPQTQTIAIKKKNHILPILMGITIVVFLIIYTLFFIKIFNFKLPFLP